MAVSSLNIQSIKSETSLFSRRNMQKNQILVQTALIIADFGQS